VLRGVGGDEKWAGASGPIQVEIAASRENGQESGTDAGHVEHVRDSLRRRFLAVREGVSDEDASRSNGLLKKMA